MSVTCKFSKRVTLIEGADTWSAKNWAYAFLKRLDLIDWGLPGELITNRNPKFFSRFWKALFARLGVNLLYNTAYHPQTNGSSKRINQTMEIALQFFVYTMEDPSCWPKVLPQIQSLLNNTSSSTTGKTPNEIAYGFSPKRPLNLILAMDVPNACVACTDAADAISFALLNQKEHYNRKHQLLFIKVGDWAMLRLYKGYSISSSAGITKKLTQQYVGPFRIKERVERLAYKLEIPDDWRIHPVFLVAQLELAPKPFDNLFWRSNSHHPPTVFVDGDTDNLKSFEIDRLVNKRTIKRVKGLTVEYLIC